MAHYKIPLRDDQWRVILMTLDYAASRMNEERRSQCNRPVTIFACDVATDRIREVRSMIAEVAGESSDA